MDFESALSGLLWHQLLDVLLQVLWCWQELILDASAIKLEETDVCDAWEVTLEEGLVVLQQIEGVLEGVNRVLEGFIHNNIHIELFVSPVDFKEWLESSEESLGFAIGLLHDSFYFLLGLSFGWVLTDPLVWIKVLGVSDVPVLTWSLIPSLQGV